ncbi:glycoside hydrolase family 3 protein [Aurantibacter crassamenti]|uniref:glycoside hydrolase family 3 protein n=1 Tax=Aurantibacter crassamenti TaxID=1837375 RepID=UPI00193A74FE|nr:glycoside hydrolase family 3 N-terminal domain-containing protein [Aurantibacter crassamenti]MBM1106718.1 glycoside hydrolase family 3 protein [Aurantibacter crassamenti]
MRKINTYSKATVSLSVVEKIGQLFMPAAFINDSEEEIQQLEELIKKYGVGGLCFFHSRASAATNFEGKKKVLYNENSLSTLKKLINRYQSVSKHPLLIAIDAEWGLAMRIENTTQYPYAITLGAMVNNDDLIFEVGRNIALDCIAAGIHWNLAPCVDINNNPKNPVIGYRSFGEDKQNVTAKATAYVKGTESEGVLTSIKHFPGHGDTATDSHLGLPIINKSKQELIENELYSFQKLINEGVDSVMVGHLSVPTLANDNTISSSISKDIIKGLLRNEMGFDGVVISDALNMHAVSNKYPLKGELEWLAFDAGNDVLCFAENTLEGIKLIEEKATQNQIEDSFKRIWHLKEKAFQIESINTEQTIINSDALNKKIAEKSLSILNGSSAIIKDFSAEIFTGISNMQLPDCQFFKQINTNKQFRSLQLSDSETFDVKNILLALFPPQVKPTDNFGFSNEELESINTLLESKNVILYLFGNPYVLNILNFKKAQSVVLAYQNFHVFQEVAAEHFLGNFEAKGRIPFNIAPSK